MGVNQNIEQGGDLNALPRVSHLYRSVNNMKPHTKRLIIATLITPWVVVPVSALYSLWYLGTWR